jgi:antitoxin HicB
MVSQRCAHHPWNAPNSGVYQAMTEQGVRKAELARRLGWHLPQVDRLFDLKHASRFDQIAAAARVLGRSIDVRVV